MNYSDEVPIASEPSTALRFQARELADFLEEALASTDSDARIPVDLDDTGDDSRHTFRLIELDCLSELGGPGPPPAESSHR